MNNKFLIFSFFIFIFSCDQKAFSGNENEIIDTLKINSNTQELEIIKNRNLDFNSDFYFNNFRDSSFIFKTGYNFPEFLESDVEYDFLKFGDYMQVRKFTPFHFFKFKDLNIVVCGYSCIGGCSNSSVYVFSFDNISNLLDVEPLGKFIIKKTEVLDFANSLFSKKLNGYNLIGYDGYSELSIKGNTINLNSTYLKNKFFDSKTELIIHEFNKIEVLENGELKKHYIDAGYFEFNKENKFDKKIDSVIESKLFRF